MWQLVKFLVLLMVLTVCFQLYRLSLHHSGQMKQTSCRRLGIVFTTLGIGCLIFHSLVFVLAGLILIMLGFRLIAHGLDRLDKKIYIDRYDEDHE